jgi:hypothetical protein
MKISVIAGNVVASKPYNALRRKEGRPTSSVAGNTGDMLYSPLRVCLRQNGGLTEGKVLLGAG